MEQPVEISGDMIRLGQLLKLSGAAQDGVHAKALIADGWVSVNGEPELRRGRQLHAGDLVVVAGIEPAVAYRLRTR
ncbi:MAG TPA: RNA-binding S4 domain-containing protein [Pedococcus sp.]|nr:RNA-binding S4 domain-containing protein [Pedococcus sp.]